MSGFYQIPHSTSDFKSRQDDVFSKLANIEKEHDVHIKSHLPAPIPDDDIPLSSQRNPTIPTNAIIKRKRSPDTNFSRPNEKWQKYDLSDVNEHHLSGSGNRHALNDFLRTRVTASPTAEKAELSSPIVFKRPGKKEIPSNTSDDDDEVIPIRAPLPSVQSSNVDEDKEEDIQYKLTSTRKPTRGVYSSTQKESTKKQIEKSSIITQKAKEEVAEEEHVSDVDDELDEFFEP